MAATNEQLEGKRVIIHPAGRAPLALPDMHSADVVTIGSQDKCIHLKSPNGDGIYKILGLESRGEDEVVVHTAKP